MFPIPLQPLKKHPDLLGSIKSSIFSPGDKVNSEFLNKQLND